MPQQRPQAFALGGLDLLAAPAQALDMLWSAYEQLCLCPGAEFVEAGCDWCRGGHGALLLFGDSALGWVRGSAADSVALCGGSMKPSADESI
jgi:hypothetical protein